MRPRRSAPAELIVTDLHGVVIDQEGWPICCEMWPGNAADVTTLLPLVERLGARFKEVWVEHRRYIVCHNEEQANKDAADRRVERVLAAASAGEA